MQQREYMHARRVSTFSPVRTQSARHPLVTLGAHNNPWDKSVVLQWM